MGDSLQVGITPTAGAGNDFAAAPAAGGNPILDSKTIKVSPQLLEELKGKSIVLIYEECILYEIKMYREGRRLKLELRQINQDKHQETIERKVTEYKKMTHLFVVGTAGCAELAGAISGGMTGSILNTLGKMIHGGDTYLNNLDAGTHENLKFTADRREQTAAEYRNYMDEAKQGEKDCISQKEKKDYLYQQIVQSIFSHA